MSPNITRHLTLRTSPSDYAPFNQIKSFYPHAFFKNEGDIVIASVRMSVRQSARPSVCPLCYLLLNHWTKFNQIWCVSYWHEWGVQRQTFFLALPPGALGRGQKVKYHLISSTKSISKIFIPNFVCVLTNERYNTYQTEFSFCPLGHAPGVGLWGAAGAQGVNFFSNMVMWYIKSTGMTSRT